MFIGNLTAHVVALMSGVVSFATAVWETAKKKTIRARVYWAITAFCFVLACDLAWQDEHRNTQGVVTLRAIDTSEKTVCQIESRTLAAYTKGLEANNLGKQQTIDEQRTLNGNQQATINNCVVSLGKMNPAINTKIVALALQVLSGTQNNLPGGPRQAYVFELVIMTNRATAPIGKLTCDQPFKPLNAPELNMQATSAVVAPQMPNAISDREYEIRVSNTGATWTADNPIFFAAQSESNSLGHCSFVADYLQTSS